jgi:hypothetical protein
MFRVTNIENYNDFVTLVKEIKEMKPTTPIYYNTKCVITDAGAERPLTFGDGSLDQMTPRYGVYVPVRCIDGVYRGGCVECSNDLSALKSKYDDGAEWKQATEKH